jgi:dihydroorotase
MLIKGAHLTDPSQDMSCISDILICDGKIQKTGKNLNDKADEIIDATGLTAAPGLVDMHVHLRDPGYCGKEDIISGTAAAAAGGVTTLAAMPNTYPVADSPEIISYIKTKAEKATAKVIPVGAVSRGLAGEQINDLEALAAAGAGAFSDDGMPVLSTIIMKNAMIKAHELGLPVLAHCEDKTMSDGGIVNEGIAAQLHVNGIPASAEDLGTARELVLARETGCPVHICHVSTAVSVDMIRLAKMRGVPVTAETCPHYFSFDETALLSRDADYRMSPPLRPESDRLAVIEGIKDGTIDAIATDHAPHTESDKSLFEIAPNGVIGMETSLAAGITALVIPGYITLEKLIDLMSTAPAKILRTDAGTLEAGKPADIVLFDPAEQWTVDVNKLHGKSKNCIFKGKTLTGRVKITVLDGAKVYVS